MPQFNISVAHELGKEEAMTRVQKLIDRVGEKYGDQVSDLEQSWDGEQLKFSFTTYGIKVSGQGEVDDTKVDVTGNIPIAAMMFKGKIESGLREQLTKLLS